MKFGITLSKRGTPLGAMMVPKPPAMAYAWAGYTLFLIQRLTQEVPPFVTERV